MKRILLIIITSTFALCSCTKEIEFKGDFEGEKLVLFSCANPDKPLTASVFKSVSIYSHSKESCTQGLKGATVTAIVNGRDTYSFREVVTTFKENSDEYWEHGGITESIEYVSDYVPETGDNIVVKASYGNFKEVRGETTVPQRPQARLTSREIKADDDSDWWIDYHFSVTIDDPAGKANYYRLNVCGDGYWRYLYSRDILFYDASVSGILGSLENGEYTVPEFFDDGGFNGQSHSFAVWFSVFYDPEEGEDVDMDSFTVTVDNVSESLYLYSRSLDSYSGNDGMFSEASIIYSNVENGMGCVGASSGAELPLSSVKN